MDEPVIRIVIADDHPVVRKGLCAVLAEDSGLDVVGEAADGRGARTCIAQTSPDIAVLEVDMPNMNGFDVVREMQSKSLQARVVFLTLHGEPELFRAAIDAGVKGYLLKESAMMELGVCVRAVAAGQMYVSSAMQTYLLQPQSPAPVNPLIRDLTPSECRILLLIADGKSSKEIGSDLSIHYRTVENHRTNICRKLGIDGSNALIRFALQHKIALTSMLGKGASSRS